MTVICSARGMHYTGNPQATGTRLRGRNVDFSFTVIILPKRPVLWGTFYLALNKA